MVSQHPRRNVSLADRFSLVEKILMRIGFSGVLIIGACGIYLENITLGIIYTAFIIFGQSVLLSYCLCSHCPYPNKYSDCLFVPARLIKKSYKFRSGPMSILEKIGFIIMIVGVVVIPQYWLLKNYVILAIFWVFCLPTYAGLVFYECKRCRHFVCPFNRVRKELNKKSRDGSTRSLRSADSIYYTNWQGDEEPIEIQPPYE
jgi:hypothetical protein